MCRYLFHPAVALNATAAVKNVKSRLRQSREDAEDPSVLVSQVLNPERSLNPSGKTPQTSRHDTVEVQHDIESPVCALQIALGVVPAGPRGSAFPRCLS